MGSLATSAVPIRLKTRSTSGSCAMRLLQRLLHLHRLREAGAGNAQRMHGDVAFVETRDELGAQARREQAGTAPPAQRAAPTTGMRCASDHRNAGSNRTCTSRMTRFSCRELPPRNSATAAGTNVSDNSIALVNASTTVIAIGWNIFPSMPVSAKIGRYTAVMIPMPNRLGRMTSAVRSRRKLESLLALQNPAEARLLLAEATQRSSPR